MPTAILDHVGYPVSDFDVSKSFYTRVLAPFGIRPMMDVTNDMTGGHGEHVGFGIDKPDFWIGTGKTAQSGVHIAFIASDRSIVDAFYKAAIAAGGRDNGPPGLRPHYHESYYGAFVLDPDGNNVEAVCHAPV
jgi:catechol 2,3-dioxygenase-like lactoylglutathione lyase family enzyme